MVSFFILHPSRPKRVLALRLRRAVFLFFPEGWMISESPIVCFFGHAIEGPLPEDAAILAWLHGSGWDSIFAAYQAKGRQPVDEDEVRALFTENNPPVRSDRGHPAA